MDSRVKTGFKLLMSTIRIVLPFISVLDMEMYLRDNLCITPKYRIFANCKGLIILTMKSILIPVTPLKWIPFSLKNAPIADSNSIAYKLSSFATKKWDYYASLPKESIRYRIFSIADKLVTRKHINEQFLKNANANTQDCTILIPKQWNNDIIKKEFKEYLLRKESFHKKWFIANAAACLPLIAATILPGVKMIVAWNWYRIWANYACYKGSQKLQILIKSHSLKFDCHEGLSAVCEIIGKSDFLESDEAQEQLLKSFESNDLSHFLFHLKANSKLIE